MSLLVRRASLAWGMLVVPLCCVLVFCVYWEPVLRDGWDELALIRGKVVSVRLFYDIAVLDYRVLNPRLGQLATMVGYALPWLHPIVTPVLDLTELAVLTALALGRWPSIRRADDAFMALVVTALVWLCTPQIGLMLCYRPYTGNYVFGLTVAVAWLLPYRFGVARPARLPRWFALVWLVVGVLAGMCNEHLGISFLAMAALATLVVVRRDGRAGVAGLPWMIAGLVGFAAGYVLLLTAPSQHLRYAGLADQAGYLERIAARGVRGNLWLVFRLVRALVPVVPLVIVAAVERWWLGPAQRPPLERRAAAVLALGGLVCMVTLLASPRIGPRLYGASVALIAAAIAGGFVAPLRTRWLRWILGVVAAAIVAYISARCVVIFRAVGPVGRARMAALERGAGTVVTLPALPARRSRYFVGDDLTDGNVRAGVVHDYQLEDIVIAAPDRSAR